MYMYFVKNRLIKSKQQLLRFYSLIFLSFFKLKTTTRLWIMFVILYKWQSSIFYFLLIKRSLFISWVRCKSRITFLSVDLLYPVWFMDNNLNSFLFCLFVQKNSQLICLHLFLIIGLGSSIWNECACLSLVKFDENYQIHLLN